MKFDIKEWKRIYDEVKYFGEKVKNALPYVDETWQIHPPKNPLPKEELLCHQNAIKRLTDECRGYMDACNMRIPPAKWNYSAKDKTTWLSDPSFKYKKLLLP